MHAPAYFLLWPQITTTPTSDKANEEEEVRRRSSAAVSMASVRAMSASVSAAGGPAPMASDVAPGGARGTAAAGKPSATPGNTTPPAGGSASFSFSSRPPNVVVASDGDVPGETGGVIELSSTGTGGLERDDDEPQQLQHRKGFPSREILSAKSLASFQSSPASRWVRSLFYRGFFRYFRLCLAVSASVRLISASAAMKPLFGTLVLWMLCRFRRCLCRAHACFLPSPFRCWWCCRLCLPCACLAPLNVTAPPVLSFNHARCA